jgi:hypothetical protein
MIEKAIQLDGSTVWVLVETGLATEQALAEALEQWRVLMPKSVFRGLLIERVGDERRDCH